MTFKKIQVTHVDKGDDKIVITKPTRSTSTGPITRTKAKSTIALSTKLTSEHTHFLKTTRKHDVYQPTITLTSLGAK